MVDQYGEEVKLPLYPLPNIAYLAEDEVEVVIAAKWYEDATGVVFFSAQSEEELNVAEIYSEEYEVVPFQDHGDEYDLMYVSRNLKRWSREDGFYHA